MFLCSFVKIIIRIFLRVELHWLKFLGAENRKIVELYFYYLIFANYTLQIN